MSNTTVNIPEELQKWQQAHGMLDSFLGDAAPASRAMRAQAMQNFINKGFPSTRWEEWKYTSVRSISQGDHQMVYRLPDHGIDQEASTFYDDVLPDGLDAHLVVLVDGHYDPQLSRILEDDGLTISSLSDALQGDVAPQHFGKIADEAHSPFISLNTALAWGGVFIHLKRGKTAKHPVYVLHLGFSPSNNEIAAQARKLIVVEENAELKVIESWNQWTEGKSFNNHVAEISLAAHARMDLYTIQNSDATDLINFAQVEQAANSNFQALTITTEGELVRNDLQARHTGEHCETHMFGLYLLDGKAHVDNHTLADHAMPNCFSNELYKGVLNGDSTAVFNGKVMVRPDAQKTNAFQSNKTILLSEGATINTKPQLEIFADDVKCSHGATTGRLDETALFYLRSRGLTDKKARTLLTYAFAAEVLNHVRIPALKAHLTALVEQKLFDSVSIAHA